MSDSEVELFAADTETCLIRKGLRIPPLVCVSSVKVVVFKEQDQETGEWKEKYKAETEGQVTLYRDAYDICVELFSNKSIWANAAYDILVIINEFPELTNLAFDALMNDRVYDVQIRQQLIDIAKGRHRGFYVDPHTKKPVKIDYTVKSLAKRLIRKDIEKEDTWRLRYGELRETPVEQWPKDALKYSQLDATVLISIFEKQQDYADMLKDQFRQGRADVALSLASAWGVRTSRTTVEEIDKRTEQEYYELRAALEREGLLHNAGSRNTKLAKKLLLKHLPREHWKLTKTGYRKVAAGELTEDQAILEKGYISLDEDSCTTSKHPLLVKYARYGAVIKLRSTYVHAMWEGVKTPMQPRFHVLVDTGRISCSAPNLTNLPREPGIRECCVPREGHVFVAADYDKAELVSLSESCIEFVGYSRLGNRLIEGFDPHLDVGAQILGIGYETAEQWKKVGGRLVGDLSKQLDVPFKFPSKVDLPTDTDYFEAVFEHVEKTYRISLSKEQLQTLKCLDDTTWSRQMAKAANFGFPGGLGAEHFVDYAKSSYNVILTVDEAIELRRKWHAQWPEMRDYFNYINSLLDGGEGFIIQPISERWRGGVGYTQCCNTFFQARTADGAKAACWEVTRRQFNDPNSALYGSHLVIFVHDELILEAPEERCHEVGQELVSVMIEQFARFHPNMTAAVKASPVAMRYWSKEAKPTYENGRLVPWGEKRFLSAA